MCCVDLDITFRLYVHNVSYQKLEFSYEKYLNENEQKLDDKIPVNTMSKVVGIGREQKGLFAPLISQKPYVLRTNNAKQTKPIPKITQVV